MTLAGNYKVPLGPQVAPSEDGSLSEDSDASLASSSGVQYSIEALLRGLFPTTFQQLVPVYDHEVRS